MSAAILQASTTAEPIEEVRAAVPELLRLFYLDRPKLTVDAYRGDLETFAAFAGAPSTEDAVARLLSLPKPAADAVAHQWRAAVQGAPATRARRLSTLRSLVKVARGFGVVDWELSLKIPKVHQYRDTAGPGLEALRTMLRAADGLDGLERLRARLVLLLVGSMGLRRGEVAKLRLGDFDPQTRRLHVVGKGEKPVLVRVPGLVADTLQAWVGLLGKNASEPSHFLIQKLDAPCGISGAAVYKIIAKLGKLAGVRTWPHGLRHTAVTEVTRAQGLVAGSKFARHEDVKTTMIYQDNLEDLGGKGAEFLAQLLAV